MKRFAFILILCCMGCQGISGVYHVTMKTEPYDGDGDGVQDGITIFLVFRDRELEPVSFYDAECTAVITVYGDGILYEKEVFFDSSELVGKAGGGIVILSEEAGIEYGDVLVVVTIEGRGDFRCEKKNVRLR